MGRGAFIAAVGPTQDLDQFTPNERKLVQVLVQDPPVLPATHREIKDLVVGPRGMAESSFNAALSALVSKEILEKDSAGKGALYDWTATGHEVIHKLLSNDDPT